MTQPQLLPATGKQCAGRAYHQLSQNWGDRQPCRVKAKYREDGSDYCGTHLPSNVAKRDRKAADDDAARWADLDAKRTRADAEHAALAGIANPAAVPEVITAARLAYGVLSGQLGNPDGQHQRIASRLQLALDDLDKKGE